MLAEPASIYDDQNQARPVARRRAVLAIASLIAGMLVSAGLGGVAPSAALLGTACLLAGVMLLTSGRASAGAGLAAIVLLGAGWFTFSAIERPPHALDRLVRPALTERAPVLITGMALSTPRPRAEGPPMPGEPFRGDSWSFRLRVETIKDNQQRVRASGKVVVFINGPMPADALIPRPGDRVEITGMYNPPEPALNPGDTRRLWTAADDGFSGWIRAPAPELVERLGVEGGPRAGFVRFREALRARRCAIGAEHGSDSYERAAIVGITLGERDAWFYESYATFQRLGVAHLLAVSGFHLVLMALYALFVLRLTGDRGWLEPVLIAVLVGVYLLVVVSRPPVARAGMLVLVMMAVEALGRRHDRPATLCWIAFGMLLWTPTDLFNPGFQLSFGLVFALMTLAPTLHARLWGARLKGDGPPPPRFGGVLGLIGAGTSDLFKTTLSTSIVCWLFAAPIAAYHFGVVGVAGFALTLALLPIVAPLLWIGYGVIVIGVLVPAAGEISASALDSLAGVMLGAVDLVDRTGVATVRTPELSLALVVAMIALVAHWLATGSIRSRLSWLATGVVVVWLGAEWHANTRLPPNVALRLDTIAVGDGTFYIVRSGSDAIVWDCGSLNMTTRHARAAISAGVMDVNTAIVSHANVDHYNGIGRIARPLDVKSVVVAQSFVDHSTESPEGAAAESLAWWADLGLDARPAMIGEVFQLGAATLEIIGPDGLGESASDNDRSLVAIVRAPTTAGERTLLLTGDIEEAGILSLAQTLGEQRIDVLEAPHHGSFNEVSARWIGSLAPSVVVQSTGRSRAGDPRWSPARERAGAWFTTAIDGAVRVEIRTDGSIRAASRRGREVVLGADR